MTFKKYKKEIIKKMRKKEEIPQGTAISAFLSNIYIIDFDKVVAKYIKSFQGLYLRYSDDIIMVLPNSNLPNAKPNYNYIKNVISEISGLTLQEEKTQIYEYKKIM